MRVLMLRKQRVALGLFVLVLFAGCATTEPLWFIATPGYVEAQIATSENAVRMEYEAEIARLQDELNAQRAVSDELVALADVIAKIENSNQELLGLADELEDRLSELPRETIRQLVEILQQHLEESAGE